jgi:hypothetical protein
LLLKFVRYKEERAIWGRHLALKPWFCFICSMTFTSVMLSVKYKLRMVLLWDSHVASVPLLRVGILVL